MATGRKPDFIGIGAEKSATTWIFECLREHPEIYMAPKKNINYFDDPQNYSKGIDWYISNFKKNNGIKKCGEFTTEYIFKEYVPERIARE